MLVYLCLGSNIGNRRKNIQKAVRTLKEAGCKIKKTSSLYKTSPWGVKNQPYFLNLVVACETKFPPGKLLEEIKLIEKEIGRKPAKKWGKRIIDIDILFYGKKGLKNKSLTIPHPQLHKRAFALVPLKEIAPRFIHPVLKKNATQMLKDANDKETVVLYNEKGNG